MGVSCTSTIIGAVLQAGHWLLGVVTAADSTLLRRTKTQQMETRRGSPVDRRPSTAEAPPIGKNHQFSKIAASLEPVM